MGREQQQLKKGLSITMNLTEQEAIELTVSKGFKGEEFATKAWKTGGCLKKDGTYKKLVKKLECHFETVEVDGTGKERVYILTNPKAESTAMADSRKGRKMPRRIEDEILTNFVHRVLIGLEDKVLQTTTYNNLSQKIIFTPNRVETLANEVIRTFGDYLPNEKMASVWSYSNWYLSNRAKKDIKLAIEHLTENKKIEVKTKWIASVHESIKKVEIGQDEAYRIHEAIKRLSIDYEIDYVQYQRSFAFPSASAEMKDFQLVVESHLRKNFGYNFIYEAMEIKVLDCTPVIVGYEEARGAFLKKVHGLVANKVKSDKYLKAQNKGEKFHYLCILLYLKAEGIEVDEHELKEEIERISYSLGEIVKSFDKPKPMGFGSNINT